MSTFEPASQVENGLSESTGILVVNLGTPDAPTTTAVRRFLRKFLFDPRVVEYPRLLWWLALNLVILPTRPFRSAAAYREIWTDQGSPILVYSKQIAAKMRARLASFPDGPVHVELAMTYSEPSIDAGIENLISRGVRRILVVPLYPQYSGTTTASVFDAVAAKLSTLRWIPAIRFVNDYHDAPGYISVLADSIRDYWGKHGRGDKLMMSFHGIPKKNTQDGDPYHHQCQKTADLLAEALELHDDEWILAFQSRVGREEWLSPYTDESIATFGGDRLSRLDVVCPGFPADCLETLEEIELRGAEQFKAAGGRQLNYIPALNSRDAHIAFLLALTKQHLGGWINDDETGPGITTQFMALENI